MVLIAKLVIDVGVREWFDSEEEIDDGTGGED